MIWIIVILLVLWVIAAFILDGEDLSRYDIPTNKLFSQSQNSSTKNPSATQKEQYGPAIQCFNELSSGNTTNKTLSELTSARKKVFRTKSLKNSLAIARNFADEMSLNLDTDTQFIPAECQQFNAEWAIAKDVDTKRRLLFFHGGAFIMGSAKGHRKLSHRLSQACNAAVLSVDYKLQPEFHRKSSVDDAQNAYRWILNNGPFDDSDNNTDYSHLFLAGDSAGGNFAVMLSSWSKQNSLPSANAVISFSPSLDTTFSSPTITTNRKTDKILGQVLGNLTRLPRPILLWASFIILRYKPCNPLISPLFYDLTDLPPTLIQASSNEILLGESIRYTNKANSVGSKVILQIWENQLHDWHIFNYDSPYAKKVWSEVEQFIQNLD